MKSKLTALFLSLLMVISYLPSSMITSYALPDESAETTQEQTNPILILDKEFDVDEVFVYKIIDGSEYEKDAFGLISYSDSLKEEISEEYLEVDKFYDKILELFKDTDKLKDLDKESDSETFEVEKEKINEQSLDLYEDIKDYLDESKQLQFNKKHELNDLEEGVYFILADKYYPQFINVTDSAEEINIDLEENKDIKSINEDEQKTTDIKDNETPKDILKKETPLRTRSSNTITAFTASIESGVQLQTVDNNEILVLDLTNKTNSQSNLTNSPIMYKVNFTLKGDNNFPVGAVQFTIPDHLYKGRNGNYIDNIDMPILEAPATNSKNFNYTHDEENHVYIITNTAELDSAYSAVFNFGYVLTGYPSDLIDAINNNNTINENGSSEQFTSTLTVNGESLTENTDKVYINTEIPNWYSYTNTDTKFYKSWPSSWGDTPTDADDYYYLELKYCPALSSTYTQDVNVEYTISDLNNSGEIIKMHWGPVSEYTYNNYACFSGNSNIQDVSTLTGTNLNIKEVSPNYSYTSQQAQTTYTLIRYPKALLDDGELHRLTYSRDFTWSGVDDTNNIKTHKDTGSFNYQKRDFTPPGESFNLGKSYSGNSSRSGLEKVFNNTNYKIEYYSRWTAYAFPHTLKDGGDPSNIEDYGYKKYHSVHIDDYFYISNEQDEYTRLTENDYFIKSVTLQFTAYNYEESNGSYQYTSKTLNSPLTYTLYGKTSINGEWIEIGHTQFNEATNKNEFIYSDGEIKTITTSNLNNISSLSLKRDDIVGLKLDTETNEVGLQSYMYCYTEFKPSNVYRTLLGTEGRYLRFINIASGYIITPDGELSSYDNSDNTSYMPYYLKNDINTLDINAYNQKIMHDYALIRAYENYYTVSQNYETHTFTNDINNSQVNCEYTLYSRENPYGDDNGNTQSYKDGAVRSQTNGTFYNLLPLGFNIDESTINVRTYNNVSDTIYTYELKPNWQNSGRTMLVVNCQTTEDVYNKGFYLDYKGYYSWNAISDYGKTLNNTFAYKTGNDEYGGYTTTYPDNGGNLPSSLKDLFIDVDEDGETTGNHRFYYTTIDDTLNVPTTASISLEKSVKSNNSSNYIAGDNDTEVVTAGENYSYQIHWGTDDHSTLSNMIVYDNLEAFKPDGVTENWHGIFDSIDLSSPRINGINPVVYYSTQSINISEDRDLSSSKWSTTIPEDKSQIKAIAIDLSKDNNNNAYTLDVNKTISIILNMKAPYNNAKYLEENNIKAYNSVYLSNRLSTTTGSTSNNLDNYEYTELGIETDKVKVSGSKRWIDFDDSERTNSVNISLYQNGTKIDTQTVSASTNWNYSFNNLQKYDNSGNEYTYTIDEDTNIENYKKIIKNIDEKGLLIHFKDTTEGNSSYLNLYYIKDGQYYRSNNLKFNDIKDKTVYVPAETVTIYSKVYGGDKYLVDNIDIIDKNNNTADIVPTYSNYSLNTNPSIIFRGLNYPQYEGDTLITSKEVYVKYIPENMISAGVYNVLDKKSISIKKEWEDFDNSNGNRPNSITAKLLKNGEEIDTIEITSPSWEKTINNLDAFDDNFKEYKYEIVEEPIENYTSEIVKGNATKIKFGDTFDTETTCDYLKIYYKDENNQIKLLTGQGASGTTGFCGSGTNMANKTVYVPSTDVYFYWHTDGSVVKYGFDIASIEFCDIEDININITSQNSTLPNYAITEITGDADLPKTTHDYGNNENILWSLNKDAFSNSKEIVLKNTGLYRSISGQKTWVGDIASARPENITVKLLRNGEIYQTTTTSSNDNWKYEFNNLPVLDNNDEQYVYTISEETVDNYSTVYSNGTDTVTTPTEGYYDIENTWNPRTITITKQWLNSNGGDDLEFRPENIKVHLVHKQGIVSKIKNLLKSSSNTDTQYTLENEYITDDTKWVKDGNTWTYTFSIPQNDWEWQVYEEEIEYYTESNLIANPANVNENSVTITNDFEPQIEIKGEKIWSGNDENYRPESITVNLLRNNQIVATKIVNESTEWKYDFGYVPVYDNSGNKYNYSISENNLDDYIYNADTIDTYNSYAIKFGNKFGTYNSSDYLYIYYIDKDNNIKQLTGQGSNSGKWYGTGSYSLAGKTIYIPSNKFYIYWVTNASNVGYGFDINEITPIDIPDNVSITSTSVSSLPINESNSINITGSTLPSTNHDYDNSDTKLWKYEGFDSIGDFNITNTLNKQSISGTKTWVGDEPEDRPESITVNLYQDGRKIDSQEVTATTNWSYIFTDVPIYKPDGTTKYNYYVEEEPVENYFTNYDKSHAGVRVTFGNDLSITNSNAFMTILYKDSADTWTRLIGQGNSNGQWNSSNINSLKNKTIEIPSLEFYITWHGTNTSQKWNVTNIEVCDDISIQEQILGTYSTAEDLKRAYGTATEVEINSNNLPVAPYNNKYEVLYHFNGTNEYKSVNLVNTYNLKNVSGTKTWVGDTASNRPENITVNLYQDGRKIAETTTNASKNWQYTFENVPIYHDDQVTEYEYYVTENPVENYYQSDLNTNSMDLTNIYNCKDIEGTKIWIGDTATNRPESITINLYQDGHKIAETTTDASKDWKYIFEDVPIYKDKGITEYEYTVNEEPVENYYSTIGSMGTKITFGEHFETETESDYDYVEIYYLDNNNTIKKLTGQGSNSSGHWYGTASSPYSLSNKSIYVPSTKVYIYWKSDNMETRYGFDVVDIQSYPVPNNITSINASLPNYSIINVTDENTYPKTDHNYNVNENKLWYYEGNTQSENSNNYTIINQYNLFNIEGTVRWQGDSDNKELRPNKVILDLYQNDTLLTTQELTITNDDIQNFEFNNIPKLDENGNEYHYVVHQRDINNYKTSNIDDLNILNQCTKRNVTGYKVWVNDKNRNSRPESIKVILYDENNNKIAEKTVTSADEFKENCWKYTFENVDVFDNNGNIKVYHVEEEINTKEYYTGYIPNYWYRYSTETQTLLSASAEDIYKGNIQLPSAIVEEALEAFGKYLSDNNIEFNFASWENLTPEQQEIFTNWTNNYLEDLADQYFDENHLYGYNYELGNIGTPIKDDGPIYSESKNTKNLEVLTPRMDLTSIVNVYRVKHLEGVKHWEDEGSQYQRPDSVTLGLYRNGEKIDEQIITADNDWKYSFVDLPEVDSDGNLYEYDIREEDLDNYITEYNTGDVTEGVQVTFKLPIISIYRSNNNSNWQQNNVYDNFSPRYGLVTVFKDGNTWYKMTLEEWKNIPSSSGGGGYAEKSAKAAAGPGTLISSSSGITFTIPSKEFYIIPVFRYNENDIIKGTKAINDPLVPSLESYKTIKLSDEDKAKLNYVRSVSKVEFQTTPYIDTFDYHMYNQNEYGVLFEKLGSSFDINNEAEHIIELKTADLPDVLDEYITEKDTNDFGIEKWIHNVAFHYNEELGLTNYPLDAKTSYSGTKIWNNIVTDDDAPDSPIGGSVAMAAAKVNKLTIKAATPITQPTSVTVVLLQDGHQYATQIIGEDTDWKFEFNDLPMFDPADHHKYEYSIKEKSVKGYKTEVLPDEETNGHQVIISSDIPMSLDNTIYVLCRYNGQWYVCDSLPTEWEYSNLNNKLKLYIPGDDFKILVRSNAYSQNEIAGYKEEAIANGQNPENYIKIDSIKAVNIPYEIHDYGDYMYYQTMNQWNYYWDAVNLDDLPVPEYTSINLEDGSTHNITLNQILTGYDNTNPDEQYNEFYNLYQYTSKVTSGIKIINTYYEGSFKIKKVDEQGRILPGCEFSLFYANSEGDTWTKAETDPTAVSLSDGNGMVSFENIPYGDYLLYETKPADGYRTPSKPWKVSINTNGSATIWDENGKLVPIQGSDKIYDMSNGVKITFNEDTDMPYGTLFIIAKNEKNNSAVIYTLNGSHSNTFSKKSIIVPSKDFYIAFMNENGGGTDTKSIPKLFSLFESKGGPITLPYGFKIETIDPIETSWNDIYYNNNYSVLYNSYEYDGITWDQFSNAYSNILDIVECNNYPESAHYEDFMEYLNKDKSTAWYYDASNIISNIDEFDNDALFEGSIITFGDNNHASVVNPINNDEQYFNNPILAFEYHNQYYLIILPKNPAELNNVSIKVPSNNIWLMMSGKYYSQQPIKLRGSTVPSNEENYGYDLGNEIVDVESITKCMMTKDEVQYALNSAMYQEPKSVESEFKPEFELTGEKQEIHWMTDTLGENDAEEEVYYNAFYHYQNDASGLLPIYEIANELTRTETILVNTDDDPIPGGVLQIIDKEGHIVDSWETTDVNHITWGLTEGEEYTIHQVSTPYPYIVAEDDTFTVLIGETTYVKVINDKAKNVVISKTVSGNGSNPDDIFNYHLVISGGHPNVTHTVQMSNGNNTTVTTDASGNATLDFTLKHNETATVVGVFKDTNISVTESGNNYIASYKIDNNSRVINESANVDLSASATMVNDDISIAYENTITLVVPTSAYLRLKDMLQYILMGFCLLGMIIIYRKNRTKKLNLTK